jgi:hypothetical protein
VTGELSAWALGVARRHRGRGEIDPWQLAVDHHRDVDDVVDEAVEAALPRGWS